MRRQRSSRRMQNPVQSESVMNLRGAYRKSKAPIWLAVAGHLEQPKSRRVEINLDRLAKHTQNGSVVIVPGKVLGSGRIEHKITLCAFSMSGSAAKKIIEAGGKVMNISEFVEKFPDGKGVSIIV